MDIDKNRAVFLSSTGEVFQYHSKSYSLLCTLKNTKRVYQGRDYTLLQLQDDSIYMVSQSEVPDSVFCGETTHSTTPIQVQSINEIVKRNGKVKKIQVVDYSIGMLFENGKLYTWGSNDRGNLGIDRSILETVDVWENAPKEPLSYVNSNSKVLDFSLSDNLLTVLTDNKKAYYCGLDK